VRERKRECVDACFVRVRESKIDSIGSGCCGKVGRGGGRDYMPWAFLEKEQ
jgi:hypothetical protein